MTFLKQFVFAAGPSAEGEGEEEEDETGHVIVKIVSSCLAYMNSCVNPILYAFLSESFRKSFTRLLCPPGSHGAAGGAGAGRRGDDRFHPLPTSEPTRWARERGPGDERGEEGGTLLDGTQATTVMGSSSVCI